MSIRLIDAINCDGIGDNQRPKANIIAYIHAYRFEFSTQIKSFALGKNEIISNIVRT